MSRSIRCLVMLACWASLGTFAQSTSAQTSEPAASAPATEEGSRSERPGSASPKVLEITTIEGQILFPKVLFISSEDPARYPESLHRTYLGSALDLGRGAPFPKHIQVGSIVNEAAVLAPRDSATPETTETPEPATPSPHDLEVNP